MYFNYFDSYWNFLNRTFLVIMYFKFYTWMKFKKFLFQSNECTLFIHNYLEEILNRTDSLLSNLSKPSNLSFFLFFFLSFFLFFLSFFLSFKAVQSSQNLQKKKNLNRNLTDWLLCDFDSRVDSQLSPRNSIKNKNLFNS